MVRWCVALAFLAALCRFGTGTAWAHALLIHTDPPTDVVLPSAPDHVRLQFSEDLNPSASQIVVWDRVRHNEATGHATIVPGLPRQMEVGLKPLRPGAYLVLWTSVSAADGHILRGSYLFFVQRRGPGPSLLGVAQGAPTQGFPDAPGLASLLAHWLELLAAVCWTGGALVSALVFARSSACETADALACERRRLRVLLRGALGVLIVSSGTVVLLQAYALAGTWSSTLSGSTLSALFNGDFGRLWIAREVLALVALAATAAFTLSGDAPPTFPAGRARLPFAALLSGTLGFLYLGLLAAGGHAAAADIGSVLGSRIISGAVGVDWLHLIGDALWFGGQIYIVLVLIPALRLRREPGRGVVRLMDALDRFSPLAYLSIALFVLSGLFSAKIHIASWYAFFHSIYGWALVVKVGLIGLMMQVSAFTVYIVRPRIRLSLRRSERPDAASDTVWITRLVRWLGVNPVLGAGVLLASSVMFSYPVPEGLSPPGPPGYALRIGGLTGTLELTPDRSGPNVVTVKLHDSRGRPVTQATVAVLTTMLDMAMGTGKAPLTLKQPGTFAGTADLGMGGHWGLRVLVYSPAGLAQTTIRVLVGT